MAVNEEEIFCRNGNLAVSDENVNHAMIIWMRALGKKAEVGVILTSKSSQEQIELTNSKNASDLANQSLVDENADKISILYKKANEKWKLNLQ